jgi:hypothetical protein
MPDIRSVERVNSFQAQCLCRHFALLKRRSGFDVLGGNDIQRRAVRLSQIRRALSETIFKSVAE